MLIPHTSLSADALDGLLKEYCARAWGLNDTEWPERERLEASRSALERGDLVVWYSEYEESAYLLSSKDIPSLEKADDSCV